MATRAATRKKPLGVIRLRGEDLPIQFRRLPLMALMPPRFSSEPLPIVDRAPRRTAARCLTHLVTRAVPQPAIALMGKTGKVQRRLERAKARPVVKHPGPNERQPA